MVETTLITTSQRMSLTVKKVMWFLFSECDHVSFIAHGTPQSWSAKDDQTEITVLFC